MRSEGSCSTVIGSAPYVPFAREFGKPVVIAGFEPLDVLRAIINKLKGGSSDD